MGPQVVIRITLDGGLPPEILADNEAEEKVADEMPAKIRPVFEAMDALLGKDPLGI